MFQLYKSRDFGLFFKDTFDFIRIHGKHFFKNYIIVNGIALLLFVAISYIYKSTFQGSSLFSSVSYRYPEESLDAVLLYTFLYLVVIIVLGIYLYAFVPIYFKLFEKHQGINFESKEIFKELTKNTGKLFKFIIASILVSIPVAILAGIIGFILAITFIGIPLLLFLVAYISFFYHSALMEYIKSDNKGVFDCFGYSYELCFQKFIPTIGALGIFLLIAIIIQSIFAIIQYVFLMIMGVVSLENLNAGYDVEEWSFVFVVVFVLEIISYIVNFFISNIIQINQGIIYYGLKEEKENINTQFTIDEIGSAKE